MAVKMARLVFEQKAKQVQYKYKISFFLSIYQKMLMIAPF